MSFKESGLPAHPLVEKAYEASQQGQMSGVAAITAKILVEECPGLDPEVLAGHLLAFNSKAYPVAEVEKEFSPRVADMVAGIKEVYEVAAPGLTPQPHLSPDAAIRMSFLAISIGDLEKSMELYGDRPLGQHWVSFFTQGDEAKVVETTSGDLLESTLKLNASWARALLGSTDEPRLEERFKNAFAAIQKKLASEVLKPTQQAKQKKSGPGL